MRVNSSPPFSVNTSWMPILSSSNVSTQSEKKAGDKTASFFIPSFASLITVSSVVYRPATNGQANLGYRISINSSVIQSKLLMVKDDNSWTEVSRIYKDTTTGSVNDTVKIETAYQNNHANDNYFRLPTLLVYEVVSWI